ncbi:3-dehydroquinate synthase [Thermodesulfobacterium sp. TA1]|uniref:3-dehydroquinate synthase n=1 Tax=Thermodesulfobacterium sp. TA1 TaxID=2234087 RepID=UPI001232BCE2|nr:3-dehydroquinate synthase [Thermodesulfobacterium sp. TA1]QER42826.1 3-dehydroquinate synthase [Thermodesulfobacterium sp. TA1]
MSVLTVKTKPPYQILIKPQVFDKIAEDLKDSLIFGKVAIITDDRVKSLYGEKLLSQLEKANVKAELFSFPAGEKSKNIETVVSLARKLIQNRFDRKDLLIALGGGVVGDITGFLASIYLRGIKYVQVPTTLLSQVDSSVGGKTGVDLPEGKNLIGTFYQPAKVYIDPLVLKTLPKKEIQNGLAEVIKYGCILKKNLFNFIARKGETLFELPPEDLQYIIYESCKIKAYVVAKDEKEAGLRRVLNFGHTIGHAIETELNYSIPHGLAVAIGMLVEARVSETLGIAEKEVFYPIKKLLAKLSYPLKLPSSVSPEKLINHLSKDKKIAQGKLTIVLLKRIGKFFFYEDPPFPKILEVLEELS